MCVLVTLKDRVEEEKIILEEYEFLDLESHHHLASFGDKKP